MSKAKILFVEDEPILANNIKKILEFEDFEVTTATDGLEALNVAKKSKPDLVISDIMMPEMDGYEFYTNFRNLGYEGVPFIYLTAKADYSDIRSGMNLGADDYLVKPIKATDLIDAINARLKREKAISKNFQETINRLNKGFKLITNHEFNTPMNGLLGFARLLKSKMYEIEPDVMANYVDYIEKSADRLNKLFKKLRFWDEMNSVVSGKNKLKISDYCSVNTMLVKVAKEISAHYDRASDLHVNSIEEINLSYECYIIDTLLRELIDNAFKFSEKNNAVDISAKTENGFYEIVITDHGSKSKAEALKNIQPFKQLNRDVFEQQGLGLGLSLADTIVKKLKGQLNFSDNEPNGILVIIQLPL
jgi:two-component system sensor histidine kinase/response regulator